MVEFVSSCTIRNHVSNWGSVVNDLASLRRTTAATFSPDGANVVIGCFKGQIRVHEVLVRNFTTLLDGLSPAEVSEARDPFGNLTLIIPDADRATLQCLAEMLYRGVTSAPNARAKAKLMQLTKLTVSMTRGRPKKTPSKWPEVDFCDPLTKKGRLDEGQSLFEDEPLPKEVPKDNSARVAVEEESNEVQDIANSDDWQDDVMEDVDQEFDAGEDAAESCSFMESFDPTLVSSPQESIPYHPAAHHVKGKHPYWKLVCGVHLLMDPLGGQVEQGRRKPQAIAYWDTTHDKPYFFNQGFLLVDAANGCHSFDLQPNGPKIASVRSIPKASPRPAPPSKEQPAGPQPKTKAAVLAYTEAFNPLDYLEDGSCIVKDIFNERTLTPSSSDNATANRRELFSWFLGHYYKGFEKRFGFTNETLEAKLWPGSPEAHILLRHLGDFIPGLEIPDNIEGKENAMSEQKKFNFKMYYRNKVITDKLKKFGKLQPDGKKRKFPSEPKVEIEEDLKDFARAFDTKRSEGDEDLTSMNDDTFSEYLSGAEDELGLMMDI